MLFFETQCIYADDWLVTTTTERHRVAVCDGGEAPAPTTTILPRQPRFMTGARVIYCYLLCRFCSVGYLFRTVLTLPERRVVLDTIHTQ